MATREISDIVSDIKYTNPLLREKAFSLLVKELSMFPKSDLDALKAEAKTSSQRVLDYANREYAGADHFDMLRCMKPYRNLVVACDRALATKTPAPVDFGA